MDLVDSKFIGIISPRLQKFKKVKKRKPVMIFLKGAIKNCKKKK